MKKLLILLSLFLSFSCSNLVKAGLKSINTIYTGDKGEVLTFISEGAKILDPWWQAPYDIDYYIINYKNAKIEKISKKKESKNNKAIYFIHGGAFVFPLNTSYRNLANKMIEINDDYDIFLVDYPVYPEAYYPSANIDVQNGYEYVRSKYEKVYVMGDSAGGNLAVSLTMKLRDENKKMPDGMILISPFLDISNSVKSRDENYSTDLLIGSHMINTEPTKFLSEKGYFEKEVDKKQPYISPIFGEFNGFPPTYLEVNEKEMLYDDSRIMKEKLEKEGVKLEYREVKNLFHVYQLNIYMQESIDSLKNIYNFLEMQK